jgi:hypothetical protein
MDTEPGTHEIVEVEHDGESHLGTTVVDALATASDTEISDMEPELNTVIDPDALDRLFAPRPDGTPRVGGTIVFELMDRTVRVETDDATVVTVE